MVWQPLSADGHRESAHLAEMNWELRAIFTHLNAFCNRWSAMQRGDSA